MFLVSYGGELRLMSFKCNPWLNWDDPENEHNSDIHKNDLFIFSGLIDGVPEDKYREYSGDKI